MMNLKFASRNFLATVIGISSFVFVSCGNNANTTAENNDTTAMSADSIVAEAVLSGTKPDTTLTGTARFTEENGRVKMTLDITVPKKANQSVAVHIHEHGSCGEMGNEAHGHWNPTNVKHGKWGEGEFHRGDIGNVSLDAEGKGTMELDTDLWSISDTDSTKNILNKAIIVHGGTDDFKSQPTGNAGTRIGCGVITRGQ